MTQLPLLAEKSKDRSNLFRIAGLYIVQGIPIGFGFESIPTLLRHEGTSLNVLMLVHLIGLPWVLNFLWAPYVENHWNERLGRRRSWILPMQLGLVIVFLALAFIPFEPGNAVIIFILVMTASFFAATQDIAVDGLAADFIPSQKLVSANAVQYSGLVFGMLIGGASVLIVYDILGLSYTMLVLAIIVFCLLVPTFLWQEPIKVNQADAVRAKIGAFFKRPNALWVLWLGLIATLSGTTLYSLWRLILVDFGWSPGQIGLYSSVGYTGFMMIGSFFTTPLISFVGTIATAVFGILCASASGLGWMFIANGTLPPTGITVGASISLGAFGTSLSTVVIYATVMRFAQRGRQPATDFTVYQSSHIFTEILLSSICMSLSVYFGYAVGISLGIGIGLLAIITLIKTNIHTLEFSSEHIKG